MRLSAHHEIEFGRLESHLKALLKLKRKVCKHEKKSWFTTPILDLIKQKMSPTSYEWTVFAEIKLEMQLVGLPCCVFGAQLGGDSSSF